VRPTERAHEVLVRGRRVRVLAGVLDGLLPPGARRVLDVGSGDGQIAAALAVRRPEATVEGVDVLVRPDAAVPVRAFDGRHLPFADGAADAVLLVDVLHHTTDPAGLLAEAARVAPVVVLKDHVAESARDRAVLRFMDGVGNRRFGVDLPHTYLSQAEWEAGFGAAGLRVDAEHRRLGLYPWPASLVFDGRLHVAARLVRA